MGYTAEVIYVKTGEVLRTLKGHTHNVNAVAITSDNKYAITGSYDGTAKLWDIQTGKEIRTFQGSTHGIKFLAIRPDKNYIVSTSYGGAVKLWDMKTGHIIDYVHDSSTSKASSEKYTITGSWWDGVVRVSELKTGTNLKPIKVSPPYELNSITMVLSRS